jgi:tripartite-type tricarboxylate transporter receptor subunit TctC
MAARHIRSVRAQAAAYGAMVMQLARRKLLRLTASVVGLPAVSRIAFAQGYPARPIRLVVGTGAGSTHDILARLIGQWLSARLGQPCVVDNRPGANSNIGTEAVVRAQPDGHTLLLVSSSSAINATLYDRLGFVFVRDIAPVASLVLQPQIMLVHPSVPAATVPEFVAYAKANPGKLNFGSAGIGSGPHVAGELFRMMTGTDMTHVPYRTGGGPALTDLLAGQIQVMFFGPVGSIEYIRTGKLRALALTTSSRSDVLPTLPTIGEFVPGYESSAWFGLGAPKQTPAVIIDRLNGEIGAWLADPKIKARLLDLGSTVLPGSPADFGKLISDETEKWGKVIRAANIKVE